MVWKLTFEHLNVQSPFSEDTFRGGVGVSLRWTRHLTTTLGATQRFDPDATRVAFGVAFKM